MLSAQSLAQVPLLTKADPRTRVPGSRRLATTRRTLCSIRCRSHRPRRRSSKLDAHVRRPHLLDWRHWPRLLARYVVSPGLDLRGFWFWLCLLGLGRDRVLRVELIWAVHRIVGLLESGRGRWSRLLVDGEGRQWRHRYFTARVSLVLQNWATRWKYSSRLRASLRLSCTQLRHCSLNWPTILLRSL